MLVTASRNSSDFASRAKPGAPLKVRPVGVFAVFTGEVVRGLAVAVLNFDMVVLPSFWVAEGTRKGDARDQIVDCVSALPLSYGPKAITGFEPATSSLQVK